MIFLYQTAIRIYHLLILAASPFNRSARAWIDGRRRYDSRISEYQRDPSRKTLWMHVSSLGEFEQGRPILESWRSQNPDWVILLSFYSPSGFNVRKEYPGADLVFYLPPDFKKDIRSLLDRIEPDLFLLVKYDFWPNLLREINRRTIPAYLISGAFRKGQFLFTRPGRFILKELRSFRHLFVQDEISARLLAAHGISQATVAGDTRVDAVMTADGGRRTADGGRRTIILGSSWPAEERMMAAVWNSEEMAAVRKEQELRVVVVPHDISEGHLRELRELKERMGLSEWEIIGTMGQLKSLYAQADLAVIGGGFGKGIHNILEPSAYGVPVLFGPNHQKFREARDLIGLGSASTFRNQKDLLSLLRNFLQDANWGPKRGALALNYLESQRGSSNLIIRHLMENNSTIIVDKWILTGQTAGNQ